MEGMARDGGAGCDTAGWPCDGKPESAVALLHRARNAAPNGRAMRLAPMGPAATRHS